MRNIKKITALKKIFFFILLILLSLEAGLRLLEYVRYSAYFKYYNNNLESLESADVRILCFGESTVQGQLLPAYKAFPAQLEDLLMRDASAGRNYKVYNMGIMGLRTEELWEIFPMKLDEYKPDIVIMLTGHNVYTHDDEYVGTADSFSKIYSLLNEVRISRLYSLLRSVLDKKYFLKKYLDIDKSKDPELYLLLQSRHKKYILKMYATAREAGAKFILCTYFSSWFNTTIREIALENNIVLSDNEEIKKKMESVGQTEEILSPDHWHPNEKGYALMAKQLYDIIIRERLLEK